MNQQTSQHEQIKIQICEILSGSLLKPIPKQNLNKLKRMGLNLKTQFPYISIIFQMLKHQRNLVNRLKLLVLIHLTLSKRISIHRSLMIQKQLKQHDSQIKQQSNSRFITSINKYFLEEVELKYLTILKKILNWKTYKFPLDQYRDLVIQGYVQLNRIKQIIKFKRFFHNYYCYYPTHLYPIHIFQALLPNITELWQSICFKVHSIQLQKNKKHKTCPNILVFVKETQIIQDLLIEFIYGCPFIKYIFPRFQMESLAQVISNIKDSKFQKCNQNDQMDYIQKELKVQIKKQIYEMGPQKRRTNKKSNHFSPCRKDFMQFQKDQYQILNSQTKLR